MMRHSWSVKFISIALGAALTMQRPVTALADEIVIPEEAVEIAETEETTVIPEVSDETVVDDPTDTKVETPGDATETEQPEEEPTDTPDEPAEEEGAEEKEETVEDETTEGEETEEEENTEEASTEEEIVDKETSDAKLAKLLTEADEEEDIELLADETDGTENDATTTTYKYAVQIYDIGVDDVWNDTDNDGEVDTDEISKGGLTFGPAIGANYTGLNMEGSETTSDYYQSCEKKGTNKSEKTNDDGSAYYRCVHEDDWSTIIKWNNEDPEVYKQCLDNGCTKAIELNLDESNSEDANGENGKFFVKSSTAITLDGDGPGVLMDIIQTESLKYADTAEDYSSLTWANSKVRAALNGYSSDTYTSDFVSSNKYSSSNSMLSAFPSALQEAIGKKTVKYASDPTDHSTVATCYDKLWLFSTNELSAKTNSSNKYENEGVAYAWPKSAASLIGYEVYVRNGKAVAWTGLWWTRSRYGSTLTDATRVMNGGKPGQKTVTNTENGLAPGFVLARSTTTDPDPEPEETAGYRYAVQIYGICVDEVLSNDKTEAENNKTFIGGLTFGPAIGDDYTSNFVSHEVDDDGYITGDDGTDSDGNRYYRCIHHDDWATIIANNEKDPYIYEKCVTNHCTKAVGLNLNEDNSAAGTSTDKVFNTSVTKYSGDGVGTLYNEVQAASRHWGDHYTTETDPTRDDYFRSVNWGSSVIRSALNGYSYESKYGTTYSNTNSILSAFPSELQSAIGQKAVEYAPSYSVINSENVAYDKLWLFSTKEIYGAIQSPHNYPYEGNQYTRTHGLTTSSGPQVYSAANTTYEFWLRSLDKQEIGKAALASGTKLDQSWLDDGNTNVGYGISPGFTLYREGEKPVEEEKGYRYAVQLYDVGVDDVWTDADGDSEVDEGEFTKGGLTFGPAIGDNYTAKSKSHTPTEDDLTTSHTLGDGSVIKGGNQKRCIHNDDWNTIILWNEIDPYVYEDCITNQCTKSVPLTMTEGENASVSENASYAFLINENYKVSGDGAGVLFNELQARSRYWADVNSGGHNWENSRVRAALNGYSYTNTYVTTNSYSTSNSVLSAFPSELQSAIGKKAVIYTKTYSDRSSTATVYDQLWLLSTVELYGDISTSGYYNWCFPNEGSQYKKGTYLAVGTSGLATAYTASGSASWSWSRTLYNSSTHATCTLNYNSGQKRAVDQSNVNTSNWGVSPCFTLSRSASDHNDVVQLPVTGEEGRDTIYTMAITLAILAMMGLYIRRIRYCE